MNTDEIERAFLIYSKTHKKVRCISWNDIIAFLYGKNDIKLNLKKKKVFFPGVGWMPVAEIVTKRKIEWFALLIENKVLSPVIGLKGSPYSEEAKELLPSKKGVIKAFPWTLCKFSKYRRFIESCINGKSIYENKSYDCLWKVLGALATKENLSLAELAKLTDMNRDSVKCLLKKIENGEKKGIKLEYKNGIYTVTNWGYLISKKNAYRLYGVRVKATQATFLSDK